MEVFAKTRRILSYLRRAVDDYGMIENGDRIAVGVSGGKDSLALLVALCQLRKFYDKKFELCAISLNLNFHEAGFCQKEETEKAYAALSSFCKELEVEFFAYETHIAQVIFDIRKESNPCSLCARMRRGALHDAALEHGCNKVALGHHFDDAVETFMMNLLNEGRLGSFSPVTYLSRKNIALIRPLIYCPEKDIKYFAAHTQLPIIESPCPSDKESERARVKQLLVSLDKEYDGIKHKIFGSLCKAQLDGYREAGILKKQEDSSSAE